LVNDQILRRRYQLRRGFDRRMSRLDRDLVVGAPARRIVVVASFKHRDLATLQSKFSSAADNLNPIHCQNDAILAASRFGLSTGCNIPSHCHIGIVERRLLILHGARFPPSHLRITGYYECNNEGYHAHAYGSSFGSGHEITSKPARAVGVLIGMLSSVDS